MSEQLAINIRQNLHLHRGEELKHAHTETVMTEVALIIHLNQLCMENVY